MSDDEYRFFTLRRLPARLTVEEVAWFLRCRPDDIQVLARNRLLRPLGNPHSNGRKVYRTKEVLELSDDPAWLNKMGDPDAVRLFVLSAAQRLGVQIAPDRRTNIFRVIVSPEARASLPTAIAAALPVTKTGHWFVSFISPTPEGAEYLGRNHRFVATLAQFLMEEALTEGAAARASRCGAIRTNAASRLTTLYLLRLRFLIEQPDRTPLLAEEVQIVGHTGTADKPAWLSGDEVLALLENAHADANIGNEERRELVSSALASWDKLDAAMKQNITGRAESLTEAHRRIRQAVSMKVRGLTVKPQLPPDFLGLLVLQPLVD